VLCLKIVGKIVKKNINMKKIFIVLVVAMFLLVGAVNSVGASGACCFSGGECAEATTAQNCTNSGGVRYAGNGTTCDDDPDPCSGTRAVEGVTAQDLEVENAGLLPTNPFYFFKNWTRTIRQVFTFNPVKKAELELEIANQRATEIEKLKSVAPQNIEAITKATANYQKNVERLKARLDGLQETSENPNIARLADQLADRSLKHQELFDELKVKFENNAEFVEGASKAQEAILTAVAVVPEKFEDIAKFGQRLENVVQSQKGEFRELRAAELVDRLEEKFVENTEKKLVEIGEKVEKAVPEDIAKLKEELAKIREENAKLRNEISALKDNFVSKFGARLEAQEIIRAEAAAAPTPVAPAPLQTTIQDLRDLSGDQSRRLKLLDEVREKASPSVKSQLNVARQDVLRQAEEQKEIGAEEAKKMILEAERLINELRGAVSAREGDISNAVRQLLERAEFQLNQARAAYDAQKYGNAFGQANAAAVAAKNALRPLTTTAEDYSRDIASLKNYYDSLIKKIQELNLSEEKYPKLFALVAEAERQLLELSNLINAKADPAKIVDAIRNVKLHLSTIEQLLRELFGVAPVPAVAPAPAQPSAAPQRVVSRCEAVKRNLNELDELLKAGRISEQDYKLKYESLKKELSTCEKESVPSSAPLPTSALPVPVSPSATEVCAQDYSPVCGVNGKTYSNECVANASDVKIQFKGECKEPSAGTAGGAPAPTPAAVTPIDSFFDVFVAIDESGQFSPTTVKVKKGGKVTWTNKSQKSVWPASAIHPTHTVYPGFDALGEINPGKTYSFIFDKVGSWKYHDHLNPGNTGIIEVVE